MTKKMLIDAVHPEETRVAVVDKGQLEDFDFESSKKRQLRGNIYLAKITRVEPSLQAAFVEFGGNRHGFLAFSEIHPDYYQLPQEDREALLAEASAHTDDDDDIADDDDENGHDDNEERGSSRNTSHRRYKIQEVVRRRQIMLVQVVKEERGNKGAALTTYLSLAGRYCVLMPNTPRGGGISRKITNATDRKRLKEITGELEVPEGMGLIVRTAGAKRTKTELKRDFEYLIKLWTKIRDLTLGSVAPCLINEEAGLVHRALRDLYDKDIEQVLVHGEAAYREAKDLAKLLMPSQARRVQQHKSSVPLFVDHKVERHLELDLQPYRSAEVRGYLVIHQTEALVAIDVNSGKATRERNIEQTALKTNLEAAEEACRQMRLRDLAGLIVIDFIDMDEGKNNRAVERVMKDCLKFDRARVQNNKISMFGLMEISRQRRRAGVLDASSEPCDSCMGTGRVRSPDSAALQLLRAIEARATDVDEGILIAEAPTDVAVFLLNEKRAALSGIEMNRGILVQIVADHTMKRGDYQISVERDASELTTRQPETFPSGSSRPSYDEPEEEEAYEDEDEPEEAAQEDTREDHSGPSDDQDGSARKGRRRRRRGGSRSSSEDTLSELDDPQAESGSGDRTSQSDSDESGDDDSEDGNRRRKRRGRRGGRRRRGRDDGARGVVEIADQAETLDGGAVLDAASLSAEELISEGLDDLKAVVKAFHAERDADKKLAADKAEKDQKEQADKDAAEGAENAKGETVADSPQSAESTVSEPRDVKEEPSTSRPMPDENPADEAVPVTASEPVEKAPRKRSRKAPAPAAETKPDAAVAEQAPEEPAAAAQETPAEAEPIELPQTEKPKTRRGGWWQRGKSS